MTTKPVLIYTYVLASAPGVVAANTFLSAYNPVDSGKAVIGLALTVESCTAAATSATDPMVMYRASGISGGTLVTNATSVAKYDTNFPDSVVELRISNPTATLGTPITAAAPVISSGSGNNSGVFAVPPVGGGLVLRPGEGFVWRTASGDTHQRWNINLDWAEE